MSDLIAIISLGVIGLLMVGAAVRGLRRRQARGRWRREGLIASQHLENAHIPRHRIVEYDGRFRLQYAFVSRPNERNWRKDSPPFQPQLEWCHQETFTSEADAREAMKQKMNRLQARDRVVAEFYPNGEPVDA